jgi:hypothetical protein
MGVRRDWGNRECSPVQAEVDDITENRNFVESWSNGEGERAFPAAYRRKPKALAKTYCDIFRI